MIGGLAHVFGEVVGIIRVLDDEAVLFTKQFVNRPSGLGADIDAFPAEV